MRIRTINEEPEDLSPLSKLIFGAIIALSISMVIPVGELLTLFTVTFVLPVLFLASIGLMSEGIYGLFKDRHSMWDDLKNRVDRFRSMFHKQDPDFVDSI